MTPCRNIDFNLRELAREVGNLFMIGLDLALDRLLVRRKIVLLPVRELVVVFA